MPEVSVKVLLFATLRKKYGTKELVVNCDGTLRSLIENVSKILGEDFFNDVYDKEHGKVRDDLIFTINGRNIKDLKGDVSLKDQDIISIFPPLAGG
ncbi:MAG: MoaD/ThiS family protein [Candidatus Bathyarchaeia archaeon]